MVGPGCRPQALLPAAVLACVHHLFNAAKEHARLRGCADPTSTHHLSRVPKNGMVAQHIWLCVIIGWVAVVQAQTQGLLMRPQRALRCSRLHGADPIGSATTRM
jgi:hypothetical protein